MYKRQVYVCVGDDRGLQTAVCAAAATAAAVLTWRGQRLTSELKEAQVGAALAGDAALSPIALAALCEFGVAFASLRSLFADSFVLKHCLPCLTSVSLLY